MGRKDDLKEARRLCYDDPVVEDDAIYVPDPAEKLNVDLSYDLESTSDFRNAVNDFVDETALPICEYLTDESIYLFLQTLIN
jgi:hypothetical protein